MKTTNDIYRHVTPRNGSPPQHMDATLVQRLFNETIRVVLHFDTSYANQSSGSVDVLYEGVFHTLLRLTASEVPCSAKYHGMAHPARGELQRDGDAFERMINESLDKLALLGVEILSK